MTTLFPEGEVGGVSSAIVLDVSGKWEVFSKKGYKGLKNELLPSRWVYDSKVPKKPIPYPTSKRNYFGELLNFYFIR